MKKRIHILTVRDHFKLIVEPGAVWYKNIHSWRYRDRFFVPPLVYDHGVPASSAYRIPVMDCEGMDSYGRSVAYFTDVDAAEEWALQENIKCPRPPKPDPPRPPFPIGTYYLLEARYYEIRQITRRTNSSQTFIGDTWEQPYELASGWFGGQDLWGTWQEKFIATFDDRDEALTHLHKLIHKS